MVRSWGCHRDQESLYNKDLSAPKCHQGCIFLALHLNKPPRDTPLRFFFLVKDRKSCVNRKSFQEGKCTYPKLGAIPNCRWSERAFFREGK